MIISDLIDNLACGAVFSGDRRYRYTLWRRWSWSVGDPYSKLLAFIGVNPSTADEVDPDPTVTRCIRFAKAWGWDGMIMLNLFAWRDTKPEEMKAAAEPVGELNDEALRVVTAHAGGCVACWGNNGLHRGRSHDVRRLLADRDVKCFKLTGEGEPWHPLYLPNKATACTWHLGGCRGA